MPGKSGFRLSDEQRDAVIGRIYEAAADPELWASVLLDIGNPIKSHAAQLVTISNDPADLLENVMVGLDVERAAREFEELVTRGEHPRVNFANSAPQMTTVYDYMHTSERAMRKDKCYQEHFRPLDVPYYAATSLIHRRGRFTVVGHFRVARHGHFDKDEIAYLNRLASHLRRSLELGRQLSKRGAIRGMEAILGLLKCPAAIVDRYLNLVLANDRFLRLASEDGSVSLLNRKVRLVDVASSVRLQRAVHLNLKKQKTAPIHESGRISLNRLTGQPCYELVVVPLSSDLTLSNKGLCLIFAVSSKHSDAIKPDFLRREFDLTKAESDVAAMLANGNSIRDIAQSRNSKLETIRSHIKSILRKTGTKRQAELVGEIFRRFAASPLASRRDLNIQRRKDAPQPQ